MNKILKNLMDDIKTLVGTNFEVKIVNVQKNNGIEKTGIQIGNTDRDICPVFYVDGLLQDISDNDLDVAKTVREAAEDIVDKFNTLPINTLPETRLEMTNKILDKTYILENVEYEVVNKEKNHTFLETVPHREFLDLAIIFRVQLGDDTSFILCNELLDKTGISMTELEDAATRNIQNEQFKTRPLMEVYREFIGPFDMDTGASDDGMFVITNNAMVHGARAILRVELLKSLADKLEDDLFVLPSSIHEIMACGVSCADPDTLKGTVRDVNAEFVRDDESLNDHIYRFWRDTGKLTVEA